MINAPTLAICALSLVALPVDLHGQGLPQYRNFQLGSDLAAVSGVAGVAVSEAKTIHERPAMLQDLEWRPGHWTSGSTTASTDPVGLMLFSFYNDQLFRIVVDYDDDRTEGMTETDIVDAISAVYGDPVKRAIGARRVLSRVEIESGSPLARWGDARYTVVLYRTSSYRKAYRLIVTATDLDDLARKALAQAVRLDDQEAPQREIARQKKERDDGRAVAEKARMANKAAFRP